MYYSSGNYEAFARPKKPAGVDGKSAYIIGTGLAALSAACGFKMDAANKNFSGVTQKCAVENTE